MAYPPSRYGRSHSLIYWGRGSSYRRPSRIRKFLDNRLLRLIVGIGILLLALLWLAGRMLDSTSEPPEEVAATPVDETEALVAVRAAQTRAGYPITVQVAGGVVILSGTVATESEREAAETVARSVVGSDYRVENRLRAAQTEPSVEAPPFSDVTDADLALQNTISSLLARDPIIFASAKAEIVPESLATVAALAQHLATTDLHVVIAGHTDSDGESEANLVLSRQRAEAVRDQLSAAGIAPNRLDPQGYGEAYPVADNLTKEGKTANRRIEVLLKPG